MPVQRKATDTWVPNTLSTVSLATNFAPSTPPPPFSASSDKLRWGTVEPKAEVCLPIDTQRHLIHLSTAFGCTRSHNISFRLFALVPSQVAQHGASSRLKPMPSPVERVSATSDPIIVVVVLCLRMSSWPGIWFLAFRFIVIPRRAFIRLPGRCHGIIAEFEGKVDADDTGQHQLSAKGIAFTHEHHC